MKIAIIGLGYVGLPLLITFAKKYSVIGFDINQKRVEELKLGIDNTKEISTKKILEADNIEFSSNLNDLSAASIYILTIPTPIDENNVPDLSILKNACENVGAYLKENDIVIFESTVYPGCTEEFCVPILEKISGLKYNENFYCGYSPERINPGDKVNTIDKVIKITSGSTPEIAKKIDGLYSEVIDAGTYLAKSIIVAEAAKVIENSQRDLNIALINELSVIFSKLNIDTLDVLEAAGTKWNFLPFRPGMVGGHCISVDPYYLTYKAQMAGYNPEVILAGRRINENMSRYAAQQIIKKMINNKISISSSRIAVLGLTFKENCPDFRNTKILDIIDELQNWGIEVVVGDTWAEPTSVKKKLNISLEDVTAQNDFDALIVAVSHNEYRDLTPKELKSMCRSPNPVIGDLKSIYNKDELIKNGFDVFRL